MCFFLVAFLRESDKGFGVWLGKKEPAAAGDVSCEMMWKKDAGDDSDGEKGTMEHMLESYDWDYVCLCHYKDLAGLDMETSVASQIWSCAPSFKEMHIKILSMRMAHLCLCRTESFRPNSHEDE